MPRLYDPPVDGRTPANGSGLPASSELIDQKAVDKGLGEGFTSAPVGWDDEELGIDAEAAKKAAQDAADGTIEAAKAAVTVAEDARKALDNPPDETPEVSARIAARKEADAETRAFFQGAESAEQRAARDKAEKDKAEGRIPFDESLTAKRAAENADQLRADEAARETFATGSPQPPAGVTALGAQVTAPQPGQASFSTGPVTEVGPRTTIDPDGNVTPDPQTPQPTGDGGDKI